jgi:hypothetical protein
LGGFSATLQGVYDSYCLCSPGIYLISGIS